mgnify:CR=1 FL=1
MPRKREYELYHHGGYKIRLVAGSDVRVSVVEVKKGVIEVAQGRAFIQKGDPPRGLTGYVSIPGQPEQSFGLLRGQFESVSDLGGNILWPKPEQ